MDRYKNECRACWCKQAREMQYMYDVWFNCNACPYAECYEPDTREQFLAGVSEREAEYKRYEEAQRLRALSDAKYKKTKQFRAAASFVCTIRKKVESNELLSKREFAKAIKLCDTRNGELLNFYSVKDLVKHQLVLLGYSEAAKGIVKYIEDLEMY